jgi:hypothetical protein
MGLRIANSQSPDPGVGTNKLDLVKNESGQPGKTTQRTKTAVIRQSGPNAQKARAGALPGRNNQPLVAQKTQQRSTAVRSTPVAPTNTPKKFETSLEYNNSGKTSLTRAEIVKNNGGRTITKGITVEVDSRVGGKLSWKEEFPVGKTQRTSESVIGYDAAAGTYNASYKLGVSTKVGKNGEVAAEIGGNLDGKRGFNPSGSIGYKQKLTPTTEAGVKVEAPGDATVNASFEVVQELNRTKLAAKYTQPLGGAGNVEFRANQDVGGGSSVQISGNSNGEVKAGLKFTQ